ncbi:MAG TPA: phosphoadenylyl-sulfate reductase [Anaerolineae bacterium]|nr:phosphoadenylyl-sulfate reductase [Anaerolineae bacterium]
MNDTHPDPSLNTAARFNTETDYLALNRQLERLTLAETLGWSLESFGGKLIQVTSFGLSGMVILDQLAKLSPGIRIITLDTGFLFAETYALMAEVQQRYPIRLEVCRPALPPPLQARLLQDEIWRSTPDLCCYLHKVVPLAQALAEQAAWLTGLRQDQASTRAGVPLIEWDAGHGLVKLNPLARWSREQVWQYIQVHQVPYNPLHDQGYASIGCRHCTQPSSDPANERSGRWVGQGKVECGIHL